MPQRRNKKISMDRRGVIHLVAYCDTCGWDDAWGEHGRNQAAIRASAKRHVLKTGHPVTIETGTSTTYKLDKGE